MLQVKRSERGLESRPTSSLGSPDALLQQKKTAEQETEHRERNIEAGRDCLQALYESTSQSCSHLDVSVLALASPSLGTLK